MMAIHFLARAHARSAYGEMDFFGRARGTIEQITSFAPVNVNRGENKVAEENVLLNFKGHPEHSDSDEIRRNEY